MEWFCLRGLLQYNIQTQHLAQIFNISTSVQNNKVCFYRCLLRRQGDIQLSASLKEIVYLLRSHVCRTSQLIHVFKSIHHYHTLFSNSNLFRQHCTIRPLISITSVLAPHTSKALIDLKDHQI